ncbi:MAG: pyruvate dehydrogenase (acetyl-transferring), homodimeric type [Gemmataceae bacterium]
MPAEVVASEVEVGGVNGVHQAAEIEADPEELKDWLDALDAVLETAGPERASFLLTQLQMAAQRHGVRAATGFNTAYVNTIPAEDEPEYPGDRAIERKIKSLVRWNAMAMVARGHNGGHIATYASAATLYEVAFNHFFNGPNASGGADLVFFQGHASPGIYARAFLEGRLTVTHLENFRKELAAGGGLSSYPHPWLMPNFWQFPTVSMGLGPITAIYQARFNRYLEQRGLKDTSGQHVWAFLGDGETDEPESLGAITLAAREKLDNLIFVINCNLQRLDGPVRGNGKIIQELETAFRGAGWNVLKVVWGSDWDPLFEKDTSGKLMQRMAEVVDGEYQKYVVETGAYIREKFFGTDPELLALVENLSDEDIKNLRRGGHDPVKVHAAFKAAVEHRGTPTVILVKTIKGYGLGEIGEGKNTTHNQKTMTVEAIRHFRDRFNLPVTDEQLEKVPFYKPADDSPEMEYLKSRRADLGGSLPARIVRAGPLKAPSLDRFKTFFAGSTTGKNPSTTFVYVNMLRDVLLSDPSLGKYIVPIIPDEARTFGMDPLFNKVGIYASTGQLYEPVDFKFASKYREATDGQILEEGITECGAMASFTAAGTAYATHGIPTIPFFIYYSMFGFQRIGDSIWAAADARCRGFLLGATAGRTTLNGEGLQHQDGHSHILASTVPNIVAYDPAFAYEIAVIIQDGIRRMVEAGEDLIYYITLCNENYAMPPMPDGVADGILKGLYKFKSSSVQSKLSKVHLLGSNVIVNECIRAQSILSEKYGVAADVWSATSYKELRRDALACERWNRLHPTQSPRLSYVESLLAKESGVFVAATDSMKALPEMIQKWVPGGLTALGTDGFGRSDDREALRRHFEVDAECITVAALARLAKAGEIKPQIVAQAIQDLGVDPEKVDPVRA